MKFITSPAITRHRSLNHAFLTRMGGVSTGPFHTLNFNEKQGDPAASIEENRSRTGRLLAFDAATLFTAHQVHGDRVLVIDSHSEPPSPLREGEQPTADAIITDRKGLAIGVLTADCVPIILVDPVVEAIGIVHAGWKGTAAGICGKAVTAMEDRFGASPENISAAIGPSIGPCCYEVGEEVAGHFTGEPYGQCVTLTGSGRERWRLSLRKANKIQLTTCGLSEGNISVSTFCTACTPDLFFSYRREGDPTGRQLSFVAMDRTGEA